MSGLKGTSHRTYEFLLGQLRKYIERQRHEQNRTALERARKVWLPIATPAASTQGANKACRFHAKGHCKFGNECRFSHVGTAMAAAASPKVNGGAHSSAKPRGRSLERKRPSKGSRSGAAARPCWASNEGNAQKALGAPMPIEALPLKSPNTSRRALLHQRSRRVHPQRDQAKNPSQCAVILPRMAVAHMVSAVGSPMMLGTRPRRRQRQRGEVDLQNPPLDKHLVAPMVLQPQQSE